MSTLALAMLDLLAGQLAALDTQIEAVEARLMQWHKQNQLSQCRPHMGSGFIAPLGPGMTKLKVWPR